MARSVLGFSFLATCLLLGACNTPPPRAWLRYVPSRANDWTKEADGVPTGALHGLPVRVDLGRRQTRIQVTVENPGTTTVEFRMGPQAAMARAAIGEVLLRPLTGLHGAPGPDMLPYNSMQGLAVDAGWGAVFYLDAPLGREPSMASTSC